MFDTFYIDLDILNNETRRIFDYHDLEEFIINKEILVYIINNKDMLLKLMDIMLDKTKYSIKLEIKNRESSITISKMSLFQELMKIIEEDNIKIDREVSIKLSNVFRNTNYNVSDIKHEVIIDNVKEIYPVNLFFEFLYLDKLNYKLISNINIFRGYELSHFVYALMDYLKKNHILDLYDFNSEVIEKIKDLASMQFVDYEAFNKYQDTVDNNLNSIKINKELESILDKEMENGKDTFDKLMKVYLKLGSLFSYDIKFFLGEYTLHKKIKNISKLNLRNNKTVCFEMYGILAYYLKKLNINYKVYPEDYKYGSDHPYIVFRYNEYLIKIDLVKSTLTSDLINIKLNDNLNGITCINKNEQTRLSFNNFLNRYYKRKFFDYEEVMLPRTRFIYDNPINDNIKELLRYIDLAYARVNDDLDVMDKMGIFLSSLKQLKNKYYLDNMDMQVVRDYNNKYGISMLISLYDGNDYMYVLYDLDYLQIFNRKDMKEIFENANITRLQEKDIPGLDNKKMITK